MTKVIKNTHRLNQSFIAYATKDCRIAPHILGDLSLFLPASVRNAREKLRQMFFNYFHFAHHDVGQAFVTALVWARQFQVIQTGGLQQRGVQIVNPHRILHRLVTEIVGRAMRERAASPRCQRCSPKARFSTDAKPARKAPRLEPAGLHAVETPAHVGITTPILSPAIVKTAKPSNSGCASLYTGSWQKP